MSDFYDSLEDEEKMSNGSVISSDSEFSSVPYYSKKSISKYLIKGCVQKSFKLSASKGISCSSTESALTQAYPMAPHSDICSNSNKTQSQKGKMLQLNPQKKRDPSKSRPGGREQQLPEVPGKDKRKSYLNQFRNKIGLRESTTALSETARSIYGDSNSDRESLDDCPVLSDAILADCESDSESLFYHRLIAGESTEEDLTGSVSRTQVFPHTNESMTELKIVSSGNIHGKHHSILRPAPATKKLKSVVRRRSPTPSPRILGGLGPDIDITKPKLDLLKRQKEYCKAVSNRNLKQHLRQKASDTARQGDGSPRGSEGRLSLPASSTRLIRRVGLRKNDEGLATNLPSGGDSIRCVKNISRSNLGNKCSVDSIEAGTIGADEMAMDVTRRMTDPRRRVGYNKVIDNVNMLKLKGKSKSTSGFKSKCDHSDIEITNDKKIHSRGRTTHQNNAYKTVRRISRTPSTKPSDQQPPADDMTLQSMQQRHLVEVIMAEDIRKMSIKSSVHSSTGHESTESL